MKKIFILITLCISVILFNNKVLAYDGYKVGYKIQYNDEDYYVIEDSDTDKDYVTLLKAEPLTSDEINKYDGGEYTSQNGEVPYSIDCDSLRWQDCFYSFDDSFVKKILENWINDKFNSTNLREIDGYKVRLMTVDDLILQ